jgi:hypothetical protein
MMTKGRRINMKRRRERDRKDRKIGKGIMM